ncbi:hypothetical protein [Shimia sp.]|uniref:hypothetical protein n=1 Tax=Shimia sp. TaxID=1954381 RepID=UPI00329A4C6F
MSDLDQRLLDAHRADDKQALVTLYTQAAGQANTSDAAGFYLTHAYVYALETGDPAATALHLQLKAMGRDA